MRGLWVCFACHCDTPANALKCWSGVMAGMYAAMNAKEGKDHVMRLSWVVVTVLAMAASWSVAQDQSNSPEEVNRKYQDALSQLKAAQDRKNELATENEKLNARLAEMQKKLDQANREAASYAQRTFQLRCESAAWQTFLRRYPTLLERWKLFIEADPLSQPSELPEFDQAKALLPQD